MGFVDKYLSGNVSNIPFSNIEIDSLATLESIKRRQGWMIAAQVATVAAIANQTKETTDALRLVKETLDSIEGTIQDGFDSLESSIERLETNLIENLNEIKWYLFNVDQKLDQLINLVKFSGATKSAEYNKQGFILYKIGSYNDAINQLNKSVQENPLNIEAYINLGFIYLREERLDESILNFEKASKLVKEDFSYFEEISQDRLKSTEVFILDNLVSLYALQDKHNQSIESLNLILSKDIDKKTEILSKYKLAKYLCLSGDLDSSLIVIKELIENQYFEPVALAVSNPEFTSISAQILSILQTKLEAVKKSFEDDGRIWIEKLDLVNLSSDTKVSLKDIVQKVNKAIKNNSNYSILLNSEFNEAHNEFLLQLDLLSELKSKSESDKKSLELNILKLEAIKGSSDKIDSKYSLDDNIRVLSHKLMLSKLKLNVQDGIENIISQFNSLKALHEDVTSRTDLEIAELNGISQDELVDYIHSKFKLTSIISKLKSTTLEKEYKEKEAQDKGKKNQRSNANIPSVVNKAFFEYYSLFAKYESKDQFSTSHDNSIPGGNHINQGRDGMFEEAARIVVINQQASASILQRKLKLGYNHAGRLIEQLEEAGIIGPFEGSKARPVLIQDEWQLNECLQNLPGFKKSEVFDNDSHKYESSGEISDGTYQEVIDLTNAGRKLEAVKLLKEKTGWELSECKEWVDRLS
jgi:tetratricopeptide (TPR) repeat protein